MIWLLLAWSTLSTAVVTLFSLHRQTEQQDSGLMKATS